MYNYVYIHAIFVLIICTICLLFVIFSGWLVVDHDATNASLCLCLFLYTYAPAYMLIC